MGEPEARVELNAGSKVEYHRHVFAQRLLVLFADTEIRQANIARNGHNTLEGIGIFSPDNRVQLEKRREGTRQTRIKSTGTEDKKGTREKRQNLNGAKLTQPCSARNGIYIPYNYNSSTHVSLPMLRFATNKPCFTSNAHRGRAPQYLFV